jgi:chromosome partitioning protein
MSTVAFISTKGGAGKSTAAVHYAIAASGHKRNPLILDCDTAQTSLHVWGAALRPKKSPEIRTSGYETIAADIAQAEQEGYDPIVIDVPPGGGAIVARIASLAEHIVIPVRASTFDLSAMRNTIDLLRTTVDDTRPRSVACRTALGKAAILLNGVPTKTGKSWHDDLMGALGQCGAGGLQVAGQLSDRAAFRTTLEAGRGATEDKRDPLAADEVEDLYRNITSRQKERAAAIKRARAR